MKYERFEQLPVWQAAMTLAEKIYILTQHRAFRRLREWKDQIRRAALSVSNNIAEGFERGTTAELLAFLYIARGSAGETRSLLLFCRRLVNQQTASIPADHSLHQSLPISLHRFPLANSSCPGYRRLKSQI